MRSIRCAVAVVAALALASLVVAQERDELLANPKVKDDAKLPTFADFTPEQVAGQITMAAGRNYAWFGFNTPEIRVVLPAADNSVYAEVDFGDPTLLDASGAEVPYEHERGIYDHDTHHDELRFVRVEGEGEGPLEFARAVGTVTVRYPIRLRTLSAREGEPAPEDLDVSLDGPFVTRRSRGGHEDLDAASFTGVDALRALDASGHQLEACPSTQMSSTDGVVTETTCYWGEVAEVQLDVAVEWAILRIDFELPAVEPLPDERAGIAPPAGDENPPTPGAKVDVQVVAETPGMAIASDLGVTPDEAVGRLEALGFPSPSGDLMVMSAVQGKADAVQLFLAAGVPIDFAVNDGRTALLSAIMYSHLDLAGFLVEAGADVNLADSNNATPLFHAAGNCGASELVRTLIEAGADPTPATRGNTTAAEMAGIMGCADNEALIRAALGD
jgi:hypothetical protein